MREGPLDLYRIHHDEYVASPTPRLVRSLKGHYLTISGKGPPEGEEFRHKLKTLFRVAYALKKSLRARNQDFRLCRLEALWWGGRTGRELFAPSRSEGGWKLMLRVPQYVREKDRLDVLLALIEKGASSTVSEVRLEALKEGLCVQALHLGPLTRVGETVEKMRAFAAEHDLAFHGRHHEIYLTDRHAPPRERRRTVVRIPVR